jgi:ketosteroid isomerase-like protein
MELSRRDLAVAGVLALGAASLGAVGLIAPALAESGDEATVKKAVQEMRTAYLDKDKAKLESMTLPQLTYSHSDGRIQDKAEFIKGVMDRKATVKSLEYPELTVAVAGDTAIVRHLWVSETELDGKTTNTRIGVMQVYKKQDGGWKLLARSSYRFPEKA